MEQRPARVPVAKQVGDAADLRVWAEPAVWTERMLTALEQGVKGGVWYSLSDKVFSAANLRAATAEVVANKGAAGVDHVSVEQFCHQAVENLANLEKQLRQDLFVPQAIRRVYIPKPGSTEKR